MFKTDFTILGGDKRTSRIAPVLAAKGYRVACYHTVPVSLENHPNISEAMSLKRALENTSVIITGIPFATGELLYSETDAPPIHISDLQRYLRKHHKLFGGVISSGFRKTCEERGIVCYDFMSDEPLSLANAVSTAEGAILEALMRKDTVLHHAKVLVLGYGRCGKTLADKLRGLSAHVTVCSAEPNELALAAALGMDTLPLSALAEKIADCEYIFNTIPARVLTKPILALVPHSSLIIDIASNQSGADYEAAAILETPICHCAGLPGKYAPQTSAEHLCDYILAHCALPKGGVTYAANR